MTKLISTQRYLNSETVEEKRAANDYTVSVSPVFQLFGDDVQLILDGHHSLEAAKLDGVEACLVEITATECDTIELLNTGKVDDFLQATWIDAQPYDVATGYDL